MMAGDAAFIQRWQVHKIRNVVEQVAEPERHALKYRTRVAYGAVEAGDAKRLLYQLHDELLQSNPSGAASRPKGWKNASLWQNFASLPNCVKLSPTPTALTAASRWWTAFASR